MYKYTPLLLIISEIGSKEIIVQANTELNLTGLIRLGQEDSQSNNKQEKLTSLTDTPDPEDLEDIEDDPEEIEWNNQENSKQERVTEVEAAALGTIHSIKAEQERNENPLSRYQHSVSEIAKDYPEGYYLLFEPGYVLYRDADELYESWALNGEFDVVQKNRIYRQNSDRYSRRRIYPKGFHHFNKKF